jgi:hypothetical protein
LSRDQAPPFRGVPAELGDAAAVGALGSPDAVFRCNDIAGDVVTLVYGRIVLTQWPVADVKARIDVEYAAARAEEVDVRATRGVRIEGRSRRVNTFVGADGELHNEAFAVTDGILFWQVDGTAFRLEGAASLPDAVRLAAAVRSASVVIFVFVCITCLGHDAIASVPMIEMPLGPARENETIRVRSDGGRANQARDAEAQHAIKASVAIDIACRDAEERGLGAPDRPFESSLNPRTPLRESMSRGV